ncbi:MAG: tetratricopeptide repeat protein [Phaeospirillum sp.]|nr:tetratricopeptide repeat protein [Phaeospirillum sp.]
MDDVEHLDTESIEAEERIAPSVVIIDMMLHEAAMARRVCDYGGALRAYAQIQEIDPERTDALLGIAECQRLSGLPHDALQTCQTLLEVNPRHVSARLEMAEVLRQLDRGDEAHAIHDLLLHEHPDSPYTWCGLARLLGDEGQAEAAEACLRRALALAPAHVPALASLARLLARRGDYPRAMDIFHHAISIAPDDPTHPAGLARSLMALGRLDEAAQWIGRALALDDECVEAHLVRADLAVLSGHLQESWHDAEWRWHRPGTIRPDLACPAWDGTPLAGGILLVHAEDSLSDTLRLIRFVPLLTERGFRVALMAPPTLIPLLGHMTGIERVLADNHPLPDGLNVEACVALPDLPRRLGFDLASLPETPWLEAPARRRRPVLAPPESVLRVGLAWAGNDPAASIPFPALLPLAEIPGIVLFALEVSHASNAAATLADPSLVTDFSPTVADFADLAGRIAELDLVIAGDCATAHLAGAMNKPVLLMLPFDAHPRWMRATDRTPWYPTMRLFRQPKAGDWPSVIAMVRAELTRRAAKAAQTRDDERDKVSGANAVQAAFLAAHLEPGDLLIDLAAGGGEFTLAALAAHPDGAVRVLAIEPHPATAEALRRGLDEFDAAEVVTAALGRNDQPVLVARTARHGRRVFALPEGIPATGRTTRLDALLADRPDLTTRRTVLRLGQTGWEDDILDSLATFPVAVTIFEHRPGANAARVMAKAGFSLWRFPTSTAFGGLVTFADEPGIVLALAATLEPAGHYGPLHLPPSPGDMANARMLAEQLTADALIHQSARRLGEAAAGYAKALMQDPFAAGANANKGVMMHMAGRRDAAIACYRRALTRAPTASVMANLATALRESQRLDEADAAIGQALAAEPDNADFLYDLALLRRDQGRLDEAARLLRRIQARRPGAAWTLAQILVATGDTTAGFDLFASRPGPPSPAPAPHIPAWRGDDLLASTLLVHQNCDLADAVLLARFIPAVVRHGGLVTMACQPELAPLLQDLSGVERVICGDDPIPPCDLRADLTDLPRLLGANAASRSHGEAYLSLPGHMRPRRIPKDGRLRVGLTWGGRPSGRACPLTEMLTLASNPDLALEALVDQELAADIETVGAHGLVTRITPPPLDLAETAAVIATFDVVVGGDTAELHLAAALGKPTWVLLPNAFTWRWPHGRDDSPWYPNARIFRQSDDGDWKTAMSRIAAALKVLAAKKRG